jgi:hypothetical protein
MAVVWARLSAREILAWGFRKAAEDSNGLGRKINLCERLMKTFTVTIRLSGGICLCRDRFYAIAQKLFTDFVVKTSQRFSKALFPQGKCSEAFAVFAAAFLNLQ